MTIRKPWAVLLAFNIISLVVGAYPYFKIVGVQPFQVLQLLLDVAMLYGLFGYVTYRRIGNLALRLLYLVLVPIIGLRVAFTIYFAAPVLLPWMGRHEQYVAATLMLSVPFALLTAYALWSYASTPRRGAAVLAESRVPEGE